MAIPVLTIGIFLLDWLTPLGIVDWVLYFIPLMLSFQGAGWLSPFPLATVFSGLTILGYFLSPPGLAPGMALINLVLGIGTLWVVAVMVDKLRRAADHTRKLTCAVDQSPVSICITDLAGRISYVNPKFSEVIGHAVKDIAKSNHHARLFRHVSSQFKNPVEFGEKVEHLQTHPSETYRGEMVLAKGAPLDLCSSPVHDQAGQYYGRIWTFSDLTEQRKLEVQFRQAQKLEGIGQLAAGVAHDFNNLLACIQMQADLLTMSRLSSHQLDAAQEIISAVQRGATLTRQLLLFSRREAFQPRDLDLSETISSTAKMLKRTLGEDIRMEVKLAAQPMFVHADAGMMDQVLLNLAVNARDAMPQGGHLIIEVGSVEFDELEASSSAQTRPGSFVCLTVSDNGSGIAPEILPRIFDPFFTTKDVGKGSGLGLATVFGIVQQHDGWINVCSETGHGTTFRLYFPRLAGAVNLGFAPPAFQTMLGGSETILLVEDDPSLRASARKILSQQGYRILEAPTGVSALKVWRQNRGEINLLLTDLVMPDGMTGRELARQVLHEDPKLKVIYMSGYSVEIGSHDFILKEGENFLTKPFQAANLAHAVRANLDANN